MGNLTEEPIQSAAEALFLIRRGEESRRVGETNLNEKSSRSHSIVRLVCKLNIYPANSLVVHRKSRKQPRRGPTRVWSFSCSVLYFDLC